MAESIISPGVFTRENDISFVQPAPIAAGAAFIGPTVKGPIEQPTIVTSYNDFVRKFGDTFKYGTSKKEFLTSLAIKNYFSQAGQTALVTRVVPDEGGPWTSAINTTIECDKDPGTQPFTLETLGRGVIYNNAQAADDAINGDPTYISALDGSLVQGTPDNLRWQIANINTALGTFSLLIRQGDDSNRNTIIIETYNNLSLDPNSDNYIEKVIGNQYISYDPGSQINRLYGDYPNRSNYVRVSAVNLPTLNYLANDGVNINEDEDGDSFSLSLPNAAIGSFWDATGDINDVANANFFGDINDNNTQGLVGTDYDIAIGLLSNKDDFQFNVISAPGLVYANANSDQASALDGIISLAETRGDCIAVVDLVNYESTITDTTDEAVSINSSYGASYWPWLQMRSATGQNVWCPAGTVIPGVYAFTDAATAPWFAPAGLVRGGIPGVIQAERKLAKSDRDILYAAKVNPIASFPGTGIAVFGQKTLQTKASALDRVNVRRLLIALKKFIGDQARNLVFEQNTITTRNKFLATVNPYLESVVQRQGLYAYRVVMDESNNTPDTIDRNQLIGQIYIQPAKTIEFVVLDFTIEPTGATFA
jgi:hypothetical protein